MIPDLKSVIVLAGGSTVADYMPEALDMTARGVVIGVNDAAVNAACNFAVTMDRKWLEYRYKSLQTLLKCEKLDVVYARKGTTQNIPNWEELGFSWFERQNTDDFTPGARNLNGSSSGTAAINLAWAMSPKTIYLLGFDMKTRDGKRYWYPDYPWITPTGGTKEGTYSAWAKRFRNIREQCFRRGIWLVNVTHDSAIPADSVPRITFKEFLEATK